MRAAGGPGGIHPSRALHDPHPSFMLRSFLPPLPRSLSSLHFTYFGCGRGGVCAAQKRDAAKGATRMCRARREPALALRARPGVRSRGEYGVWGRCHPRGCSCRLAAVLGALALGYDSGQTPVPDDFPFISFWGRRRPLLSSLRVELHAHRLIDVAAA
ncbi:hypothetical protein B0H16DRAFT_1553830, partial [Mycena metata]